MKKRVNVKRILENQEKKEKKLGVRMNDELELEAIDGQDELDEILDEELDDEIENESRIGDDGKEKRVRKSKFVIPEPPADRLTFEEYLDWQKTFTEETWNRLTLYVYRKLPVIDRKRVNPKNPSNIDKIVEPISANYFEKMHGGGTYQINVNYNTGKSGKTLCLVNVKVPMEIDPILNLEELDVDHHLNRGFVNKLKNKGLLDHNLEPVKQKDASEINMETIDNIHRQLIELVKSMREDERQMMMNRLNASDNEANKAALELLSDASKKSMDMIVENAKSKEQNPVMMMEMLKVMKEVMAESKKSSDDGSSATMVAFMQYMMEESKANKQLMAELLKGKAEPANSLLDSVEKIISISQMIGGLGGERHWSDKLIDKASELIPGVLSTVNNAFMLKNAMMQQEKSGMVMAPQQQQMRNEFVNPQEQELDRIAEQYVMQYGGFVAMKIAQGKSGSDFAYELYETFSPGVFENTIREPIRNVGVERIVNAILKQEQLRMQVLNGLGSEEAFRKWCMEFMSWSADMMDENEGVSNG